MSLIERLSRDFGQFSFVPDKICRWSSSKNTIFYNVDDDASLLHELGHALCDHKDFNQDIELLHAERDAWSKAREIAPRYGMEISDNTIETAMDSYRDWLHARSTCPECGQNGVQSRLGGIYCCINCNAKWTANDARRCGLRRRKN